MVASSEMSSVSMPRTHTTERAQEHHQDQGVALELRDRLQREGGHDRSDADDGRGVVPVPRVEQDVERP